MKKFVSKLNFDCIFVLSHPDELVQHGYIDYENCLKRASGNFKAPALSENDGASMFYTSVTTGNPKGVLYSHRSQVLHRMSQAMEDS